MCCSDQAARVVSLSVPLIFSTTSIGHTRVFRPRSWPGGTLPCSTHFSQVRGTIGRSPGRPAFRSPQMSLTRNRAPAGYLMRDCDIGGLSKVGRFQNAAGLGGVAHLSEPRDTPGGKAAQVRVIRSTHGSDALAGFPRCSGSLSPFGTGRLRGDLADVVAVERAQLTAP